MQHFGEQQCELVATEPGGHIGPAQALVQPVSDLDEDGVTRGTAVFGVDAPEVLEVDRDDTHHIALRVAFEKRALHAVEEEGAVGELCERIVERAVGQLALERGEPYQPVV
jgi:hypothetical protein